MIGQLSQNEIFYDILSTVSVMVKLINLKQNEVNEAKNPDIYHRQKFYNILLTGEVRVELDHSPRLRATLRINPRLE